MAVQHELDLRLIARQARDVAALIKQPGPSPDKTQTSVKIMPLTPAQDLAQKKSESLQKIGCELEKISKDIDDYLSN